MRTVTPAKNGSFTHLRSSDYPVTTSGVTGGGLTVTSKACLYPARTTATVSTSCVLIVTPTGIVLNTDQRPVTTHRRTETGLIVGASPVLLNKTRSAATVPIGVIMIIATVYIGLLAAHQTISTHGCTVGGVITDTGPPSLFVAGATAAVIVNCVVVVTLLTWKSKSITTDRTAQRRGPTTDPAQLHLTTCVTTVSRAVVPVITTVRKEFVPHQVPVPTHRRTDGGLPRTDPPVLRLGAVCSATITRGHVAVITHLCVPKVSIATDTCAD